MGFSIIKVFFFKPLITLISTDFYKYDDKNLWLNKQQTNILSRPQPINLIKQFSKPIYRYNGFNPC